MIEKIVKIAQEAGTEIIQIYHNENFWIEMKDDNSPVTKADLISNQIIIDGLRQISNYPIVTEESPVDYKIRKSWDKFWPVDPLDGTKDFIERNGEFSINIALIENQKPILGVVYIPLSQDVYYAVKDGGAYKNKNKIYNHSKRNDFIGCDSNFHSTQITEDFFKRYCINKIKKYGSSLKISKLAEGEIDVYPRFNGTKEWDTAACHIIANEAGCKIIDIVSNKELVYNKECVKNNFFIATRNDLDFIV